MGTLQRDLKQRRPFDSREAEAYLNLVRTTDLLTREVAAVLKAHQLSEAQYNVLRILRGPGPRASPALRSATAWSRAIPT